MLLPHWKLLLIKCTCSGQVIITLIDEEENRVNNNATQTSELAIVGGVATTDCIQTRGTNVWTLNEINCILQSTYQNAFH